jgi:hypothetical protein
MCVAELAGNGDLLRLLAAVTGVLVCRHQAVLVQQPPLEIVISACHETDNQQHGT